MWFVGIDWAEDHHDVAVTDEGAGLLARFRVAHSVAGLEELVARVAALGADRGEVRVALERPDGLLVANLLERGYAVYPVTPRRWTATGTGTRGAGPRTTRGTPGCWRTSCAPTGTASRRWGRRARWPRSCG